MIFRRTLFNCCRLIPARSIKLRPSTRFIDQCAYRSASTSSSSQSAFQRYKYAIVGAAAITTGALGYVYFSQKSSREPAGVAEEAEEEVYETKFVDEKLDEKLAILEKHGPIPYLLIGAGTASFSAFRAIRSKDPTSRIVVLGDEPFYPYMRPPLSKELWFEENPGERLVFKQWSGKERSIYFEQDDFYCPVEELFENKNGGVSVLRGVKVVRIDPTEQKVYLDSGRMLSYEKCLLATGAEPKNLPVFDNADDEVKKHIMLYRGIGDYHKLNKILKKAKSVAIVGGGFLGSELAFAVGRRSGGTSLKVTQVFPESGNLGRVLPEYLCKWTMEKVRNQGVNVIPNVTIKNVACEGKTLKLQLNNDQTVSAEHVVVAVGVDARTELAESSGLEIDEKHGGFLVNTELEARKNLWIAGDASCFYDTKLGRRRVEHHDHAVVSGRLAGENMTGSGRPYWHQSMFWSDLGPDVGFEGIGLVDSSLETVGVFAKTAPESTPTGTSDEKGTTDSSSSSGENKQETSKELKFENTEPRLPQAGDEFAKGIVFYLRKNTIVGIVLWNVFAKMSVARKIINEAKPYDDLAEVAKHFDLKSTPEE